MSRFFALPVIVFLALLPACSSGGGGGGSGAATNPANPKAASIDKGPQIADDRMIRTSELSPEELAQFNEAWRHFTRKSAVWPIYRDEWLGRGGAAPYVLSENLFRYFWAASLVSNKREIERVAETAGVIGEPAVAYFAKTLVADRWPLSKPITTEVMDPENLNKRIKKTFYHFEMDDVTRQYAARVLAEIGPPAVPTLTSDVVIRSSRPTSRRYAAYALGRIGTPDALEALFQMLSTAPDWQDRAAAATALVEKADSNKSVQEALYRAAENDRDDFVRRKANRSLAGADRIKFY